MSSEFNPASTVRDQSRRRLIASGGVLLAGPLLTACSSNAFSLLDFTGGRAIVATDPKKPYRAVDPGAAAQAINAYRARFGIAPMTLDSRLNQTAHAYASTMAAADRLSHDIGGGLRQRLNASGYKVGVAGENIGVGYRNFDDQLEGWKNSPAHDRGMKDADMTLMGIASVYDPKTKWQTFWCLQMAKVIYG